jgi:hypothetical protein
VVLNLAHSTDGMQPCPFYFLFQNQREIIRLQALLDFDDVKVDDVIEAFKIEIRTRTL